MSEEEKSIEIKDQPVLECPHCKEYIIIERINCAIFRHGTLKNGKQIDPHAPKKYCDDLFKKNLIYGCGKPFRITLVNDKFETEICDYI
jgi:hypothetical protein